jgi:hypothetical protein
VFTLRFPVVSITVTNELGVRLYAESLQPAIEPLGVLFDPELQGLFPTQLRPVV